jgi:5,10-methylenetetrahydromethanopterin reductase
MRVGLALWPDRDVRALAELCRTAERAGFDELWWPDHYDARECSAVLTACVLNSDHLTLGTAVTSPLLRHPAVLASMFATLSETSGGRIVAGLGPGGFEVVTELRVTTPSPLGAMRESVAVLRALMSGRTISLDGGRYFPVGGAKLSFRGASVPVYLAGRGPRMIELAGEIADGVITHGLAVPYLQLVGDRVRRGAERAGRDAGDCIVSLMFEVAVDRDMDRARDALRPRCLYMVGGEYAQDLVPLYGLDPDAVAPVRDAVRARDPNAPNLIDDEMVDAFSVGGSPDRIAEKLAELGESGVQSVILSPGLGVDPSTITALGNATRGALR